MKYTAFWRENRRVCSVFKILSTYICWKNIYKMQHLKGSGTPVLYIGSMVLKSWSKRVGSKITLGLRHKYLTTAVHLIPELKPPLLARGPVIFVDISMITFSTLKSGKILLQNVPLFSFPCLSKFLIYNSVSLCRYVIYAIKKLLERNFQRYRRGRNVAYCF
jgi:hypothetical protein